MTDGLEEQGGSAALALEFQGAIEQARKDAREDPFGNPVLRVTLWLSGWLLRPRESPSPSRISALRPRGRASLPCSRPIRPSA
jgi:phosphoenolpyruvate carboxylase